MASAMAKGGAGGYNFAEAGSPVDVIQKVLGMILPKTLLLPVTTTIALQMANYRARKL